MTTVTVAQLIKLVDDLKTALDIGDQMQAYAAPPSVLPAGCPLYVTVENASKIFSISQTSLRALIRRHSDFPVIRIGTKIVVDVPGLYEWLHAKNGGEALDVTPLDD